MQQPRLWTALGFVVSVLMLVLVAVLAQEEDWEDEEGEFVELPPGLVASYATLDGQTLLSRVEAVPRLPGSDGGSPHPTLPREGYRITWRGCLVIPYDETYTFWLDRSNLSDVRLRVDGKPVEFGEPVEVPYGNVPVEISGVHRRGTPDFQLAWENESFVREPIHPRFLAHDPATADTPAIKRQALEDSGAALGESFGCFRCHEGPEPWVDSLAERLEPEAMLPGPRFSGLSGRVHRAWLENFLRDPSAHRPGTRMPAQFGDTPADQAALKTIVAYLGSGQTAEVAGAEPTGSPERGEVLFDAAGCAACHEPPEGSIVGPGVPLRIPSLARLGEKWTAPGLGQFLQDPLATRLHGRMPAFPLEPEQADDLAAYLLTREDAGRAPQLVALPDPQRPVEADPRQLVDPSGNLLMMDLDEVRGTLRDSSDNGHHGTASGPVTFGVPGHRGRALRFGGEDAQVVIDGSEHFNTNADFTWTAWIQTTQAGVIFGRNPLEGAWAHGGKALFVRGGRLCFDVGWVSVLTSKTPVNDGQWHHVAVTTRCNTKGDRDTTVLYIDGQPDASRDDWDIQKFPEENFVLKLGRASTNFPQNESFRGLIDEVTAWSRALDPAEITALAEGQSHLADTEAALFAPGELRRQWVALGENPEKFDRFGTGRRLKAVAVRQLAAKSCLNCHDDPQSYFDIERHASGPPTVAMSRPPAPAPPLVDVRPERLEVGCLAEGDDRGAAPRFDFSADERAALRAYVESLSTRRGRSPMTSLAIDMKLLNCAACHDNQQQGGEPLVALLGGPDDARFITPPSLTGVAARLRSERLDQYLREGTRRVRLRPWLAAQMPGFGDRGGRLAEWLCLRDRVDPPPKKTPKAVRHSIPESQLQMGRLLVSDKGLTCTNCHAVNGMQPSGEIDPSTRSPDLGLVWEQVREDYFRRLLRDPARFFPDTKMPVALPKDGPAPVQGLEKLPKDVLATALWNYLSLGRDAPEPLEEDPMQKLPDMLRVFVQRGPTFAGNRLYGRGIACGFPLGTLLFDADGLEPAALWFEGFLIRVPTNYFGLNWRVPEPFENLSSRHSSLVFRRDPGQPWQSSPLPLESDPNTGSRFDGYTVGQTDIAFRYRLLFGGRQVPVEDRLRVDRRDAWRGFVRELKIEGLEPGAQVAWTLPAGEDLTFFTADGQAADASAGPDKACVVVCQDGRRRCAIRIDAPEGSTWQTDGQTARLVSPRIGGGRSFAFRVDRWTYAGAGERPTAEELASLCDPARLNPPPIEKPSVPEPKPDDEQLAGGNGGNADRPAAKEKPFTYKQEQIPPPSGGWRPSGTAFTSDGWMYGVGLTEGRVYRAKIPPVQVPDDFKWELYATGLNIPTGMNVVDDRLFVSHRPEVTELIDADGDGTAETFRTVMGPWSLKDGFHEYAFGLAVDLDKRLYIGLNNGYFWSYGGPTHRGRFRSYILRTDLEGHLEPWGWGCRVPNGICRGPDGQIFYVDNQGDWIQVCKIVHCRKGVFYGHPETEDQFLPEGEVPDGLTSVWIPYTVIRSAAALRTDETGGRFGPFQGQMFTGDTGYGQSVNIMRVAFDKVEGVYQGAAFRFIDGPPRGPQHTTFGPDGHMYISCLTDGLVRIRWGGVVPMEIHHIEMRRDGKGFTLHFTRPLAEDAEATPETIRARRWYYPYGIRYGSPRYEEVDVPIERVTVSRDRKSIDVELPIKQYKNGMVYYFHVGKLASADGQPVEHPEAWYTVQRVWGR